MVISMPHTNKEICCIASAGYSQGEAIRVGLIHSGNLMPHCACVISLEAWDATLNQAMIDLEMNFWWLLRCIFLL